MNKRITSLLLSAILAVACLITPADAEISADALAQAASALVAEENRSHAGERGLIDAIEITDLEAPRAGAAFDTVATIAARAGDGSGDAAWRTPVIWTDRAGNPVTTARAGGVYMPFITFYVPTGYTLRDVDVRESLNVTLPRFFAEATDKNGTLYFLESPSTGLLFITGEVTVPADEITRSASGNGEIQAETIESVAPTAAPTLEPELMVHTNAETVDAYGAEYIKWLIETVKNVVEPRAVNLLIESFPVYEEALKNGGLSGGIGFFVEQQEGTIATVRCAALVYKGSGGMAGKAMRVVVNADYFAVRDADSGQYKFNEALRSDLEFTLTHELLHATMYDITYSGMLGLDETGAKAEENRFPLWFTEGAATAVDNAYSYRRNELLYLCLDLDRYAADSTAAVSFTPERLIANYRRLSGRYDINGGAEGARYAYTSGYLASLYLMQLASEHLHGGDHAASRSVYQSGDMREGFNYILEQLRGGVSLDQIIREISPADAAGRPVYGGLSDYQSRFLNEGDRDYSAAFCASFLKYLESLTRDGQHSWGSILIDFDDMRDTLFTDGDAPTEPLAYKIEDTGDYVTSDVPIEDSLAAGGATLTGPGAPVDAETVEDAAEPGGEADLAAKVEAEGAEEASFEAVDPSDEADSHEAEEPRAETGDSHEDVDSHDEVDSHEDADTRQDADTHQDADSHENADSRQDIDSHGDVDAPVRETHLEDRPSSGDTQHAAVESAAKSKDGSGAASHASEAAHETVSETSSHTQTHETAPETSSHTQGHETVTESSPAQTRNDAPSNSAPSNHTASNDAPSDSAPSNDPDDQ